MSERIRYQMSASVFVMLIKEGEICMLRRKGTGWMDGSFSIPAGGLDAGETIRAAAAREAYEEVGVNIAPENLHYVHTLHSKTEGRTWLGHFFQATIWEGTPS
uniref:NUDIX domain-containing protein n=1 Tax=Brucella intermedia TaxID=94625 RepID=UPI00046ACCDC